MTVHKFKITDGCPETGHKIACNTTQAAPAFNTTGKSAAERAEKGMATYAAYRANAAGYREAKEAERVMIRLGNEAHRKMLRPDELK